MIKVRYYESKAKLVVEGSTLNGKDNDCILYSEKMFTRLMCGIVGEPDYKPFRDKESRRLLKESFGVTIVEDDWYSVYCEGYRTCFSDLCRELKYGLVLIDTSRRGHFLICESMTDEMWNVMRSLDFDILIAASWEDMDWMTRKLPHDGYVILNYPYNDGIEVTVQSIDHQSGFYKPVSNVTFEDMHIGHHFLGYDGVDDSLYLGEDGKYYSNNPGSSLRFYWRRHLDEVIDYIDNLKCPKKICEINDSYSKFEFAKFLSQNYADYLLYDPWADRVSQYKELYKEKKMTKEELRAAMKELNASEEYQTHVYYRDTFRIINHMPYLPEDLNWRKVAIPLVIKNKDGSYNIGGDVSCKYPEDAEIIEEAIRMCLGDCDTLELYVDCNEILDKVSDLGETKWAILIHKDSIELFDKWDGLKLFGEMLKEALASGKCEISHGFY